MGLLDTYWRLQLWDALGTLWLCAVRLNAHRASDPKHPLLQAHEAAFLALSSLPSGLESSGANAAALRVCVPLFPTGT